MPLLASEVMDHSAAVYLDDATKSRWTFAVLLPYLRSAYGELQSALESNDLPPLYEVSAVISVPANTTDLTLPADFILPIRLEERAVGETRWQRMDELSWEPDEDRTDRLRVWIFREGKVQLLGATTTREVRLRYTRSLNTISTENTTLEISNAKEFLAARTAGLAASFGGRATERGTEANLRADGFKVDIIGTLSKRMQDKPVRRRGFYFPRRRRA